MKDNTIKCDNCGEDNWLFSIQVTPSNQLIGVDCTCAICSFKKWIPGSDVKSSYTIDES